MFAFHVRHRRWLGIVLGLAFVLVGVFGIFHFAMNMGGNMAMTNCPFMDGGSSVCPMVAIEHIALWQKTITAIPSFEIAILFLIALLAMGWQYIIAKIPLFCAQKERFRDALAPPPLLERLFSSGLLNSKTF